MLVLLVTIFMVMARMGVKHPAVIAVTEASRMMLILLLYFAVMQWGHALVVAAVFLVRADLGV